MEKNSLIFVYNANSGSVNAALDFAHKLFKPSTYSCSLCKMTYGNLGVKKTWKHFLDTLSQDVYFYHKDEFTKTFPDLELEFPCVLHYHGQDQVEVLIKAEEFELLDLDGLMAEIQYRKKN